MQRSLEILLWLALLAVPVRAVEDPSFAAQGDSSEPTRRAAGADVPGDGTVRVRNTAELRRAVADAKPGTTIRIAPGLYQGGISARGLRGEPGRPIVLTAADPDHPPVIEGGVNAMHFSGPAHLEVRNLTFAKTTGNGINIDDGGELTNPAHHIVLYGLRIHDVGPEGNRDGIKLSGVDEFVVEACTIERWGSLGSGIDMVGCHKGRIVGSTFRHGDRVGNSGVQAKGGSRDILITGCRFEHAGGRAVNIGGGSGMQYFRPRPLGYEAKEITVEDCTFVGSDAPVAFVGVDGATVQHNTIYRPRRYAFRILQETPAPEFVPSRNGRFLDNIIAFRAGEMTIPVNIGPGTAPETFSIARNVWYCLDDPSRSRPRLPVEETEGVYGTDPKFRDAERGDVRLKPGSPVGRAGARRDEGR